MLGTKWLLFGAFFLSTLSASAQIAGLVEDETGMPVVGASASLPDLKKGAVTDFDGRFTIDHRSPFPVTLLVQFIGYADQRIELNAPNSALKIRLRPDTEMLKEVSVVERRLSEKQKASALTVEAMDAIAMKETPSVSFYEGLGNLKGVDLTSASIGFKVINTRGFNSTSPVRSLQLIDGVDNQAPGLNFSLGNFLGASELDVLNVDVIAGASTAFYGPNAFNGVIAMTTKNPFIFEGLDVSYKVGERNLHELAIRWADKFTDEDGKDRWAYKINAYLLRADDWVANNMAATENSPNPEWNPGGYDAVNRYGDEIDYRTPGDPRSYPGLGTFHRRGIEEVHLVDYDTRNLKFNTAVHYKTDSEQEFSYAFNFGFGTTVYQGDNRFSLRDIQFVQNKIEWKKENKFFLRAYSTNENAGNSYDAYFTALRMQDSVQPGNIWANRYAQLWNIPPNNLGQQVRGLPGYPDESLPIDQYEELMQAFTQNNLQALTDFHRTQNGILEIPELVPGTPEFQALRDHIRSTSFADGGALLEDRSSLYHLQGEYIFDESDWGKFRLGGNGRLYRPNSNGTIFSDTNGRIITNYEFGLYGGWEKRYLRKRLKASATLRMDKNQNFDLLVSPALSLVYDADELNTIRFSISSAIRNPTLQDQYLYYNVGPARLLGNLDGYEDLITLDDLQDFLALPVTDQQVYQFNFFDVAPIRPEKVQTAELGYRSTLWDRLYLDLNYYYSWYQDFIGYQLGLIFDYDRIPNVFDLEAFRISTNARDQVTTQGFSAGLNYYFGKYYSLSGNYTWNALNSATEDPIIPAFNTPENKYNISIGGREMPLWKEQFGFNLTYKWIEGFLFEGSPQFTGTINSYALFDAQVNYRWVEEELTLKIGASNLLDQKVFQVYGGPNVGRLAYISLAYAWR